MPVVAIREPEKKLRGAKPWVTSAADGKTDPLGCQLAEYPQVSIRYCSVTVP